MFPHMFVRGHSGSFLEDEWKLPILTDVLYTGFSRINIRPWEMTQMFVFAKYTVSCGRLVGHLSWLGHCVQVHI